MSAEKFSDARLREALATLAEVAGDGTDCPPPERLWMSSRNELGSAENEEVILHIVRCTACASAWKIARDLSGTSAPVRFPVERPAIVRRGWFQLAAAAAVLLSLSVGIYFVSERQTAPVYREHEATWLRSLIDESRPLPRERFILRWTAGPDGTVYDVRVSDEALNPLAGGVSLDRPEFQVPEEALEGLTTGSRTLWQVIGHLPDGSEIESDTFFAEVD